MSPETRYQWVRFQFSSTNWKWFMRKPGTYGGEVLIGSIQSNGEVCIDFCDFRKLRCTDGSGERLETYYAISPLSSDIDEVNWMTPNELNDYVLHFDPHPVVPATWALWQKVIVEDTSPASECKDKAIISINLVSNLMWVDPEIPTQSKF